MKILCLMQLPRKTGYTLLSDAVIKQLRSVGHEVVVEYVSPKDENAVWETQYHTISTDYDQLLINHDLPCIITNIDFSKPIISIIHSIQYFCWNFGFHPEKETQCTRWIGKGCNRCRPHASEYEDWKDFYFNVIRRSSKVVVGSTFMKRVFGSLSEKIEVIKPPLLIEPEWSQVQRGTTVFSINSWGKNDYSIDSLNCKIINYYEHYNLDKLLHGAGVVILPYKFYEASSLLIEELKYFRIPVLTTRLGGLEDYIDGYRCRGLPRSRKQIDQAINTQLPEYTDYLTIEQYVGKIYENLD